LPVLEIHLYYHKDELQVQARIHHYLK